MDATNDVAQTAQKTEKPDSLLRFFFGLPLIFAAFLLLATLLKSFFLIPNWAHVQAAGPWALPHALLRGLQFDIAAALMLLAPFILTYLLTPLFPHRTLRRAQFAWLAFAAFLMCIIAVADAQYFQETGKHLTHEATAYKDLSVMPVILGAWKLQPWLCSFGLLLSLAAFAGTWWWARRALAWALPQKRHIAWLAAVPIWASLAVPGVRGLKAGPLDIGDALISTNPYINATCLGANYSILRTLATPTQLQRSFYDEPHNIRVVQSVLLPNEQPAPPDQYPLLRESAGVTGGNRRNVVIFFLESWSGKDIGCLGGDAKATPFFDKLASEGLLFTQAYACGIRTPEGLFSILCSFPNQPDLPIMRQKEISTVHWRSLSQILMNEGYDSIFIHGRKLSFDRMNVFLKSIGFKRLIDMYNFPGRLPPPPGQTWPGFHDAEVMQEANRQFAQMADRPFLGAIYTMNTHPPFMTPRDFPLLYPPKDHAAKFLNSLRYADHALEVFFDAARKEPYFKNTIFVLVADHARTQDKFTYANQHHIPLLIYAPGLVEPARNDTVVSQLDVLPTVLGLLEMRVPNAAWGRDVRNLPPDQGFALSIARDEGRWHQAGRLLVDGLADGPPLLFDTASDPECLCNIADKEPQLTATLQERLRSFIALSQTLIARNGVFPTEGSMAAAGNEGTASRIAGAASAGATSTSKPDTRAP